MKSWKTTASISQVLFELQSVTDVMITFGCPHAISIAGADIAEATQSDSSEKIDTKTAIVSL